MTKRKRKDGLSPVRVDRCWSIKPTQDYRSYIFRKVPNVSGDMLGLPKQQAKSATKMLAKPTGKNCEGCHHLGGFVHQASQTVVMLQKTLSKITITSSSLAALDNHKFTAFKAVVDERSVSVCCLFESTFFEYTHVIRTSKCCATCNAQLRVHIA